MASEHLYKLPWHRRKSKHRCTLHTPSSCLLHEALNVGHHNYRKVRYGSLGLLTDRCINTTTFLSLRAASTKRNAVKLVFEKVKRQLKNISSDKKLIGNFGNYLFIF